MSTTGFIELVNLTEHMLRCAEAGDWSKVQTLDDKRRELLDSGIQSSAIQPDSEGLQKIAELNDEILQLARNRCEHMRSSLSDARQAVKACQTYLKTQSQ